MSKETIVVISAASSGYRRGGVPLAQGPNVFDVDRFNEAQLEQLRDDPRITLAEGAAAETVETNTGDNPQGAVAAERLAELVAQIGQMDKEDAALWKEDGSPKASAYPKGTTAEERDAAWEAFTADLDKA